jgi:hypothetical protein
MDGGVMINLGDWRICVFGSEGGGGVETADHKENILEEGPAFLAVVLFGSTPPFPSACTCCIEREKEKERSKVGAVREGVRAKKKSRAKKHGPLTVYRG